MMEFATGRWTENPDRLYEGRAEYLSGYAVLGRFSATRLCNVVSKVNKPLKMKRVNNHGREGGTEKTELLGNPGCLDWGGFPWITMVLGSGCSGGGAEAGVFETLPSHIRGVLEDRWESPRGEVLADIACRFARSLIADRLGLARPSGDVACVGSSEVVYKPDSTMDRLADLTLLTALLSQYFFAARSRGEAVMSRSGRDVVEARLATNLPVEFEYNTLVEELLNQIRLRESQVSIAFARAVADGVVTDDWRSNDRPLPSIQELLQEIARSLSNGKLNSVHLQLLTEVCWFAISRGSDIYPGWSDLLMDLAMMSREREMVEFDYRSGQLRPALDTVLGLQDAIARIYELPTSESWKRRRTGGRESNGGSVRFYRAAAAVLEEQAAIRLSPKGSVHLPVASAFVTTFDLELEMALWEGGGPFVIAMPVIVAVGTVERPPGYVCWLGRLVHPKRRGLSREDQLDALRQSGRDRWFVLSGNDEWQKANGPATAIPIVVRLAGCPLVALPDLSADEDSIRELRASVSDLIGAIAGGIDPEDELRLIHAVLIDEYSAMHQTAVEFQRGMAWNFGLPDKIVGTQNKNCHSRFWMVMGTQTSDSAVRQRLASQLVQSRFAMDPLRRPTRSGVVVSRHLDPIGRELLFWYGFDAVIDSDCRDFTSELEHYTNHLGHPEPNTTFVSGGSCKVK